MSNPFGHRDKFIGRCRPAMSDCQYYIGARDFIELGNVRGKTPSLTEARGNLVLIHGGEGHGKSVLGHKLLHKYHVEDAQPVDLMYIKDHKLGDTYRKLVVDHLHRNLIKINGSYRKLRDEPTDHVTLSDRLVRILNHFRADQNYVDRIFAVRLPKVEFSDKVGPQEIWNDLKEYATAADQTDSLFLWEHSSKKPTEWNEIDRLIARSNDYSPICLGVEQPTEQILDLYIKETITRYISDDTAPVPALGSDTEDLLRTMTNQFPEISSIRGIHDFMELAYRSAIDSGDDSVQTQHLIMALATYQERFR